MRAVVVGGAGVIGCNLADSLLEQGNEIREGNAINEET